MRYDRLPFIRIERGAATGKEAQIGATAQMVFDLMKKTAHAHKGRIYFPAVAGLSLLRQAERHLFRVLGRVNQVDDRYIRNALARLEAAGLIVLTDGCLEIPTWSEIAAMGWGGGIRTHRAFRICFVHESPSFARLPMMTKAFAHQLLRIAGDDGEIDADPDQIMQRLAWGGERHIRERGLLAGWVGELLADGYLVPHPSAGPTWLQIKNFARFQPAQPADEAADSPLTSHRRPTDVPLTSHRRPTEKSVNPAQPFTSRSGDRTNERSEDQIPPNPPGTGGGQAELFSGRDPAETRRANHASVRRRHTREPRMPAAVPMPPSGFPARFETAFAAYPNHRGTKIQAHGVWLALAAELGEQVLFDRVMEHLAWKVPTHWADGIGVPYFERYLHKRQWSDPKPANPDAEKPAARGAARDFEAERREREKQARANALAASSARTARAIEAERAERAAAPSREEAARQRALDWTDFRKDRNCAGLGYHAPADPAIAAVVNAVMAQRVAEFRAAYPAQPLPRILREYLAAQAPPAPAPAAPLPPPAPPRRAHIPAGAWPPRFTDAPGAGVVGLRLVGQPAPAAPDPALELLQRLQRLGGRVERLEAKTQPTAAGGRG